MYLVIGNNCLFLFIKQLSVGLSESCEILSKQRNNRHVGKHPVAYFLIEY